MGKKGKTDKQKMFDQGNPKKGNQGQNKKVKKGKPKGK